ncbi:hypothetical protein G5I_08322 [Acromyrmex echinatior]|uniref:Uncharacterized protein n=1 Tax=Acromyrmex echinatior TaxID=103372 RepID=F4WR67_ACREC|nr:hypothetical protein G5I_08322 [Acromyrmex echinatior]
MTATAIMLIAVAAITLRDSDGESIDRSGAARPQPHTTLVYLTSQPEVPFDPMGRQGEPTRSCIYDLNFQLKYHPNRVINESIVQTSNI